MRSLSLPLLVLAGCNEVIAADPLTSTFDVDAQGWTIVGDAQAGSAEPTWKDTGGNPDGYIEATDDVAGGTWYFSAPDGWLGDRTASYGQDLTFDLEQSSLDQQFDAADVILWSGETEIAFDTADNPGTTWTPYVVTISADAGWELNELGSGVPATQDDLLAVLGDLTGVWIRGEYVTGDDTGGLDNAILGSDDAEPTATTPTATGT